MLLSIIIPAYNKEQYIKRCMDSICSQLENDMEVIAIDDGSTDRTGFILDKYKARNIHIIHQENRGLSETRNVGVKNAKGEWVTFLDADDWIDVGFVIKVKEFCFSNEDTDWILLDHFGDSVKRGGGVNAAYKKAIEEDGIEEKDFIFYVRRRLISEDRFNPTWIFLYKSSFIHDHDLTFRPETETGEDNVFNISYAAVVNSMKWMREAFYHYEAHDGSLSLSINEKKIDGYDKQTEHKLTYAGIWGLNNEDYISLYHLMWTHLCSFLWLTTDKGGSVKAYDHVARHIYRTKSYQILLEHHKEIDCHRLPVTYRPLYFFMKKRWNLSGYFYCRAARKIWGIYEAFK